MCLQIANTKLFQISSKESNLEMSSESLKSCIYCDNKKIHCHDISGGIKFIPREGKVYISFTIVEDSLGLVRDSTEEETDRSTNLIHSDVKEEAFSVESKKEGAKVLFSLLKSIKHRSDDSPLKPIEIRFPLVAYKFTIRNDLVPEGSVENCQICDEGRDPPSWKSFSKVINHFSKVHGYQLFARKEVIKKVENPPASVPPKENLVTDPLECEVCLQVFKNNTGLKKHSRLHTKDKIRKFSCHICDKKFVKALHLQSHVLCHKGARPYECSDCDKKYTTSFALKNHRRNSHNEGEKPQCEFCHKFFFNNSAMRKHVLRFHNRDPRLKCPECGSFYLRKDNLEKHIQTVHRDKVSFKCKDCEMTYISQDTLMFHRKSVHGVRPWDASILEEGSLSNREVEEGLFSDEGPGRKMDANQLNISGGLDASATEALLKNLTPQPDYLLKHLTPIPLEALEDMLMLSQ